jgi:parallel beta-helix repeat protein
MRGGDAKVPVVGLAFVLVASSLLSFGSLPAAGAPTTPHAPILITGNAEFTAANGVSAGSGTPANPYVIEGWTIDASAASGIHVRDTDASFLIRDVGVHDGGLDNAGIWLENVTNGRVASANVTNDGYGVFVVNSENVSVSGVLATDCVYDGLAASASSNVTFSGSTATGSGEYGFHLLSVADGVLSSNNASGNGFGVGSSADIFLEGASRARVSDNRVTSAGGYGIYVASSPDSSLIANRIANHTYGIYLEQSDRVSVVGNTITGAVEGVYVHSDRALVEDNLLENNTLGIFVTVSGNATINNNRISTAAGYGVSLVSSHHDILGGNEFTNTGLFITGNMSGDYSSHTITVDNLVNGRPLRYHADCTGVNLDGSPTGQLIVANCTHFRGANLTIGQAAVAAQFAFVDGAELSSSLLWGSTTGLSLVNSSGVRIFHNSFVSNEFQASANTLGAWDGGYPLGGNYWSNYAGSDNCSGPQQADCPDSDGIGDSPHSIAVVGTDRYPLMRPSGVAPLPMDASFTVAPASGDTDTGFVFNASHSSDPNGPDSAIEARWDWNNDDVWDTNWTMEKIVDHTFATPGTYTVRLEIRDAHGVYANASQTISVAEASVFLGLTLGGTIGLVLAIAAVAGAAILLFRSRRRRNPPLQETPPPEPPQR